MKYLTPEQVLFIHARVISETGGLHGIRDLSMLESAVGRPQASYGGRDLYESIYKKAAALLHSLINDHPFVDGNKRTGFVSAGMFLQINGYPLKVKNKTAENFTLAIAIKKVELAEIEIWLERHCKKNLGK
jgi:death-on-curing protein